MRKHLLIFFIIIFIAILIKIGIIFISSPAIHVSTPSKIYNFTTASGDTAPVGFYLISNNRDNFTFIGKLINIQQKNNTTQFVLEMASSSGKFNKKTFTISYSAKNIFYLTLQNISRLFPDSKYVKEKDLSPQSVALTLNKYIGYPIVVFASLKKDDLPLIKGTPYTCNQIILAELQQNKFFQDECIGSIKAQIYIYEKS